MTDWLISASTIDGVDGGADDDLVILAGDTAEGGVFDSRWRNWIYPGLNADIKY